MIYYAAVEEKDGHSEVRIPDLGVNKSVEGVAGQARALGILLDAIQSLMNMRRPVPPPIRGRAEIAPVGAGSKLFPLTVPLLPATKIRLYQKWLESRVSINTFAKKAGVSTTSVLNLFNLEAPTGITVLSAAARAMGCRLVISLEEM